MKKILILMFALLTLFAAVGCASTDNTKDDDIEDVCNHSFADKVIPPSCTDGGYTLHTCSICNLSYSDSTTLPMGHEYIKNYIDASCIEYKTLQSTCSVCGDIKTQTSTVSGTLHSLNLLETIEPTDMESGYSLYKCSLCKMEKMSNIITPVKYSKGLGYEYYDGKWYVRDIGTCTDTNIVIPNLNEHGHIVEGISNRAFADQTHIRKVFIPSSVTKIDSYAFSGCTLLENVTLPKNIKEIGTHTFVGCTLLDNVTLPKNLTNIPNGIFAYCTSLKSVTLPSNATVLGSYAFDGCTSLKSIILNDSITTVGAGVFANCTLLNNITLPKDITAIYAETFYNCTSLKEIEIPQKVTSIGESAFENSAIMEIYIPTGVTMIDEDAFYNCANLRTAIINTKELKRSAFSRCAQLETIVLCEGITEIPDNAFQDCRSLKNFTIPDSVVKIGMYAFSGCILITELTLPESLVTIGVAAFSGCTGIQTLNLNAVQLESEITFSNVTTLNIGENVKIIPRSLCRNNNVLTNVTLPEGVERISAYAFSGCNYLMSVSFPTSIEKIETYAFCDTAIKAVRFAGVKELTIEVYAFKQCTNLEEVDFANRETFLKGETFDECTKLITVSGIDKLSIQSINDFPEQVYTNHDSMLILGTILAGHDTATIESTLIIPEGIRYILPSAFSGSAVIRSVSLPSSLEVIGDEAFKNCTRLTDIIFADRADPLTLGISVFEGCSSLKSITFPEYITEIPSRALYGCTSLEEIYLPKTLVSVANDFHFNYKHSNNPLKQRSLKTIYFSGNKEQWQALGFSNDHTISQYTVSCTDGDIIRVLFYANDPYSEFYYTVDTNLSLKIHSAPVPTNSGSLFPHNKVFLYNYVRELVIEDGIENVDISMFWSSTCLENIVIPPSLRNINLYMLGASAWYKNAEFYDENGFYILHNRLYLVNSNLSGDVTIPSGVQEIGGNAFYNCKLITSVHVPEGVTYIGSNAFYQCDMLEEISLPTTLKELGSCAFSSCKNLKNVLLPEGVEILGSTLFASCPSITEIIIPSTVKEYAYVGFHCDALTKIIIKTDVNSQKSVAEGCYKLKYVIYEGNPTYLPQIIGGGSVPMEAIVIPSSITEIHSQAFGTISSSALCFMSESNAKSITDFANILMTEEKFRYYIYNENPTTSGNWWHYDANGNPAVIVL